MKQWEVILLIFIIIITLVLIIFSIYYISFHKKGKENGEKCDGPNQCKSGHYCGGNGKCVPGTEGKKEGALCELSSECIFGLKCINGNCSKDTPKKEIPSFSNSKITTKDSKNNILYLTLDDKNKKSFWSEKSSNNTFSYSESKNELTSENKDIMVNSFGFLIKGTSSKFVFTKDKNNNIKLLDGFGNIFQITTENNDAIFNDPKNYSNINQGIKSSDAILEIISENN